VNKQFAEKTVFFFGATGGIGSAFAQTLIESGQIKCLVAVSRDITRLEYLQNIAFKNKVNFHKYECDLQDEVQLKEIVQENIIDGRSPEIVITTIGYSEKKSFGQQNKSSDQHIINVNLIINSQILRIASSYVDKEKKEVWFINFSALAAYYWTPFQGMYSATKIALIALCDAVSSESFGLLKCSHVLFAGVDTEFLNNPGYSDYKTSNSLQSPSRFSRLVFQKIKPQKNLFVGNWLKCKVAQSCLVLPSFFHRMIAKIDARNSNI
jgi:short-subunit dehydrogenase